ncbi:sensor histidine kinase [Brachybacterium hainanense]|uniref:Sensor histidine kinase n=1 Tax=Brachybacterium hainanense TaxID=1541174 RepID=A0ABV6RAB6_9MICO
MSTPDPPPAPGPAGGAEADRSWAVFRLYTVWSVALLLGILGPMIVAISRQESLHALAAEPSVLALMVLQALCGAAAALRVCRAWSTGPAPSHDRWDLPRLGVIRPGPAVLVLALVPVAAAAAAARITPSVLHEQALLASVVVLGAALLLCVPVLPALAGGAVLLLVSDALGLVAGQRWAVLALLLGVYGACRSSLWLGAMVRELEQAREARARLAVAEERLRFARDLHDVTGRDLSVIAVTAELSAQLAERGDARAAHHAREVAQIARTSLAQMRALVRGYREADLAAELRGTLSLLRSAGIETEVRGEPALVPAAHAQTAAWVLREAGTNLLRHAQPARVRIEVSATRLRVANDGAPPSPEGTTHGSGLRGLAERLGQDGRLETTSADGWFTLTARFGTDAPEDA